jgi:hypothetical protein
MLSSIGIIRFDAAQCVCAEFCRDLRSVIDVVECSTNFGSSLNPPGGGAGAGVDRDGLDRRICDSGLFPARKGQEGTRKIGLLDEDRGEDFDPDMIIARHLAYRASAAMPPRVHRPAPQRPRNAPASFGRKQL